MIASNKKFRGNDYDQLDARRRASKIAAAKSELYRAATTLVYI